jgi:hypothetical protein
MASTLVDQIVVVNCLAVAVAVAENWAVHRHYPNQVPDLFLLRIPHELAARSYVRDPKLNSTLQPQRELS